MLLLINNVDFFVAGDDDVIITVAEKTLTCPSAAPREQEHARQEAPWLRRLSAGGSAAGSGPSVLILC